VIVAPNAAVKKNAVVSTRKRRILRSKALNTEKNVLNETSLCKRRKYRINSLVMIADSTVRDS
jgi:hypothetical protein